MPINTDNRYVVLLVTAIVISLAIATYYFVFYDSSDPLVRDLKQSIEAKYDGIIQNNADHDLPDFQKTVLQIANKHNIQADTISDLRRHFSSERDFYFDIVLTRSKFGAVPSIIFAPIIKRESKTTNFFGQTVSYRSIVLDDKLIQNFRNYTGRSLLFGFYEPGDTEFICFKYKKRNRELAEDYWNHMVNDEEMKKYSLFYSLVDYAFRDQSDFLLRRYADQDAKKKFVNLILENQTERCLDHELFHRIAYDKEYVISRQQEEVLARLYSIKKAKLASIRGRNLQKFELANIVHDWLKSRDTRLGKINRATLQVLVNQHNQNLQLPDGIREISRLNVKQFEDLVAGAFKQKLDDWTIEFRL